MVVLLLLVWALRPLVAFFEANPAMGSCYISIAPSPPLQGALVPLLLWSTLGFLDGRRHFEVRAYKRAGLNFEEGILNSSP